MEVIESVAQMRAWTSGIVGGGESVGLVPTMGCLHDGHVHLMDRARSENDRVVLSVFVNPLQFRRDAYENYPRRLENDLKIAQRCGVDAVFVPSVEEVYPCMDSLTGIFDLQTGARGDRDSDLFTVDKVGMDGGMDYVRVPERLALKMDGADHPWHFDGVATVVRLLFEVVMPQRAYFGQKDIQQVAILDAMNSWLGTGIELVQVPVVRANDGVSWSSRLVLLDDAQREIAGLIAGQLERFAGNPGGGRLIELIAGLMEEVESIDTGGPILEIDSVVCVDPVTLEPLGLVKSPAVIYIAYIIDGVRLAETRRI